MDAQFAFQVPFDFLKSKPVVVEPSEGQVTSDAGLLPFRQFDRHSTYVDHSFLEMTRMRVYGILADYADRNDHDVLRSDPLFKLICDRSIEGDDLASQPTLSRFENAIDVRSFFRLRDLLIDQFITSFDQPPTQLTLDIDPFDDPTHRDQQLTFFHGYYGQYQYLPRAITYVENDLGTSKLLDTQPPDVEETVHAVLNASDEVVSYVEDGRSLVIEGNATYGYSDKILLQLVRGVNDAMYTISSIGGTNNTVLTVQRLDHLRR